MAAYDVDVFRTAHAPWAVTIDGKTFTGRHVSVRQVMRFQQLQKRAGTDSAKHDRAWAWLLRRCFPWRLSYLLRGDPVRLVLHDLEPAARKEALADFFACALGTTRLVQPALTRTRARTTGTPWRAQTATRTT